MIEELGIRSVGAVICGDGCSVVVLPGREGSGPAWLTELRVRAPQASRQARDTVSSRWVAARRTLLLGDVLRFSMRMHA